MHSNERDMVERYKNLRGQCADWGTTRLNTKIKTVIMYILYMNLQKHISRTKNRNILAHIYQSIHDMTICVNTTRGIEKPEISSTHISINTWYYYMCKHYTYMFWPEPKGQPDNSEAEAARLFWLAKPWHCRSASAASRPAGRAVLVTSAVARVATALPSMRLGRAGTPQLLPCYGPGSF